MRDTTDNLLIETAFSGRGDVNVESATVEWRDHIVLDPDVLAGKPVIKVSRSAVEFIVDRLAHGWTE